MMSSSSSSNNHNHNHNNVTPRIQISLPRRSPSPDDDDDDDIEEIRRRTSHESRSNNCHHDNCDDDDDDDDDDDEEQEFDMEFVAPVVIQPRTSPSPPSAFSSTATYAVATVPSSPAASRRTNRNDEAPSSSSNLWDGLRNQSLDFPINTECTSLCLSPSGNFLWAGFSDGTLRVFDLTGHFSMESEDSWWDDSAANRQKSTMMLPSKFHQRFGAVACQIHARGVHTDLLMQVDLCGDYVFGGVPRGAMELYAVSTKDLEAQVHHHGAGGAGRRMSTSTSNHNHSNHNHNKNILDSIHVHVHADAKLKGFGACTQLQHASRPTYLLLTGKGIKNIHIWKFQPPLKEHDDGDDGYGHDEAIWEQLYDTQTNGNTIHLLSFYRTPLGKLWGVSQSDTQKLRLWDLSCEEEKEEEEGQEHRGRIGGGNKNNGSKKPALLLRPKRPPYQDVANSQGALAIAGGYGVCGGPTMYNQLSIVSLDQPKSAYNHTELALPTSTSSSSGAGAGAGAAEEAAATPSSLSRSGSSIGRTGRQRRGDLKQLVSVATLPNDSNHALLELDDGSIVHYTATDPKAGRPNLDILTEENTGIAPLPADFWCRTLCLGKPASGGGAVVVAAVGMYNPNTQLGHIEVRALQPIPLEFPLPPASPQPIAAAAAAARPSSPIAVDNRALSQLCMQAPPSSGLKKKLNKKKLKRALEQQQKELQQQDDASDAPAKRTKNAPSNDFSTSSTAPIVMTTPRRTEEEEETTTLSHSDSMSRPEPILVEPSTKKLKKKKKISASRRDSWSSHASSSSSTAATMPPALPSMEEDIIVKPAKKKKSPPPVVVGDSNQKPIVKKRTANFPSVSPPAAISSTTTEETFIFQKKKVLPLSTATTTKINRDAKVFQLASSSSLSSLPPQVSPSASTPSASTNQVDGGTPSSTESSSNNKADHGAIAKFLKPMRVLHNYSEKDGKKQQQKLQQKRVESMAKVASPPVPRKAKKASDESIQPQHKVVAMATEKPTTESTKSKVAEDTTRVEFKVRKTLKIQVGAKSSDASVKKRPETAMPASNKSSNGNSQKRPRTEPSSAVATVPEDNLVDVASMLVDLKSPPAAPRPNNKQMEEIHGNNSSSNLSREDFLVVKAKEEYRKLCRHIDSLPKLRSRLLQSQNLDAFGCFVPQSQCTRTINEHRATHDMIQTRLLRTAQATLRSFVDDGLTHEAARSELKDAIRSYQEVLHDTLQRQELELEALVDVNGEVPDMLVISYRSAFDKVQEIYKSLEPPKRPPGRPKTSVA